MQIRLSNNGTLMQNFNTSDMAHKIPRCIEWLSSIHALEPGDIVATGTNHRGLNPFMDGDKIELEIDGIGELSFTVKDGLNRKWERVTRLQMHERAAQKTPGAYPDITPQMSASTPPRADPGKPAFPVMAGLAPAIHAFQRQQKGDVDHRVKPGDDDWGLRLERTGDYGR